MSPILPENRVRYPENWKEIRAAILKRARNCCEWVEGGVRCRVVNGSHGSWSENHFYVVPDYAIEQWKKMRYKVVRIVLTIAHLDHQPENNDPANLMAMCQRHHNRYDMPHRIANRKRRKALATPAP